MDASQVLTLQHNPFPEGERVTFTITGGQTDAGDPIAAFSASFDVLATHEVYLPLVTRGP